MPRGRDTALVRSVGSGRKWQARQQLLPESEERSTAFGNSMTEKQKVVGMTKRKGHLLEMGPSVLRRALVLVDRRELAWG